MAIITPTINKIIKLTEFDLLRTAITQGNMYMCIDSQKLYYDETVNKRVVYNYKGIKTYNDLINNVTPQLNTTYYCWEDNSLWLWMNKWITLWSDKTYPSAYVYDNDNKLNPVYRYDQPLLPADDNGLLHDGSVVIRDSQRIIKGKIYINDNNDNMVISSFLGGGVRILPNGKIDTDGEFYIDDEGESFIRAQWSVLNNESYIDYSEKPELDPSEFPKTSHKYQIFHEGNLDTSLIREITGAEIYTKLTTDTTVPNPMNFNVTKLGGLESSAYARAVHTHTSANITDFNEAARAQSLIKIREMFSNMHGEGIDVSFTTGTDQLNMSANSFVLSFGNGASGSATVDHLTDTTVNLTVDPTKHIHSDYISRMDNLQDQIDRIITIDPADYYNKSQINVMIENVTGSVTPIIGKPVLVDSQGILEVETTETQSLGHTVTINMLGDIIGSASTNFSSNSLDINLSAQNIVSNVATSGKAVLVNSDGNLPVNSTSASALDHNIIFNLTGEATGSATLDTALNTLSIPVTLNPGANILKTVDLGVTVASLDEQGKVPASQLPATQTGLTPQGYFNPNDGYPSENPSEGQFWVANTQGTLGGNIYQVGDWCLYLNSQWNHISTSDDVRSVNGYTGDVVLTYSDVNAIPDNLIDYTLGNTIPANKIVRTYNNGQILGASVSNLNNPFSLLTDSTGDIKIDTVGSTTTSTDGSNDLNIKLEITQDGYTNIINNAGITIQDKGITLTHQPYLNFKNGLAATLGSHNDIEVSLAEGLTNVAFAYWDGTDTSVYGTIMELYASKDTTPFVIFTKYNNKYISYFIDKNSPAPGNNVTVNIVPSRVVNTINQTDSIVSVTENEYMLNITFVGAEVERFISQMSISDTTSTIVKPYITTDVTNDTTPFTPTLDAHPTNKHYVDNKVAGDVSDMANTLRLELLNKGYVPIIYTTNVPTTSTAVERVGGLCINTTTNKIYQCIGITTEETIKTYTWREFLAPIPEIIITQSQVISLNPITINVTTEQQAILENEDIGIIKVDGTALGIGEAWVTRTCIINGQIIFEMSANHYNGSAVMTDIGSIGLVYNLTTKAIVYSQKTLPNSDTTINSSSTNNTVSTSKAVYDYTNNNFLNKGNTTAFTPTLDYHPATKLYVDTKAVSFKPFPDEFITNQSTETFFDSVLETSPATGMVYLGGVEFTDMPEGLMNSEVELYVYPGNVLYAVMRSADISPYHWECNNFRYRGWEGVDKTAKDYANTNFLNKTNTTAFTPTTDYHPATKKYVDDATSSAGSYYIPLDILDLDEASSSEEIIAALGGDKIEEIITTILAKKSIAIASDEGVLVSTNSAMVISNESTNKSIMLSYQVFDGSHETLYIVSITKENDTYSFVGLIDNIVTHSQIEDLEHTSHKVTSISSSSTDTQYPSAKAVYDYIQSLDSREVEY